MDDDKILEITGEIEKTLGQEAYATISDKIGELLTGNSENLKEIAERDSRIQKLKDTNAKLVEANGSLLQKVPVAKAEVLEKKVEPKEQPSKINLADAFDSRGNFIH